MKRPIQLEPTGDTANMTPAQTAAWWRQHLDQPRFVYFIQEDTWGTDTPSVKIGEAYDPVSRLGELQCGNPRALNLRAIVLATDDTEKRLHIAWAHARIRGEWFGGGAEELILRMAEYIQHAQVRDAFERPLHGSWVYQIAARASRDIRPPRIAGAVA